MYERRSRGYNAAMQSPLNSRLLRRTYLVSFLAVLTIVLIAWKLSGFLTGKGITRPVFIDSGQRCNAILQQMKWIKTHPKDNASSLANFIMQKELVFPL